MDYIDRLHLSPSVSNPFSPTQSAEYGYNAGAISKGVRNTYIGFQVAMASKTGNDNVMMGCNTGSKHRGGQNVVIGNFNTPILSGNNNVIVGHASCIAMTAASNNTCIGSMCSPNAGTHDNTCVGTANTFRSNNSIVVGASNQVYATNAIVLGNGANVVNNDSVRVGDTTHNDVSICGIITGSRADVAVNANLFVTANLGVVGVATLPEIAMNNWRITTERADANSTNLDFSSQYNRVFFDEAFEPGVLNFTGQHRCVTDLAACADLVGKIVRATGEYQNLDGDARPTIDESVPVVALTAGKRDNAVFGVISAFKLGRFKIGNLAFDVPMTRVRAVVNSVGEGGVWVCDEEGDLRNGDLVTSSSLPGIGCRQVRACSHGDDVLRACTVAKITCDCFFTDSDVLHGGGPHRLRFVGCVYK